MIGLLWLVLAIVVLWVVVRLLSFLVGLLITALSVIAFSLVAIWLLRKILRQRRQDPPPPPPAAPRS